jgi:hypothetical protein
MDAVLHFIFWGLVECVFFRIGRFVVWCGSVGHVTLNKATPLQDFLVALVGFVAVFLAVAGLVLIAQLN